LKKGFCTRQSRHGMGMCSRNSAKYNSPSNK
jgi:hypothetical protein